VITVSPQSVNSPSGKARFLAVLVVKENGRFRIRPWDQKNKEWFEEASLFSQEPDIGETIEISGVKALYVGSTIPNQTGKSDSIDRDKRPVASHTPPPTPEPVSVIWTNPSHSPTPVPVVVPSDELRTQQLNGEKFPQTRTRFLSQAQVEAMNLDEVKYAIREMYARGGYVFSNSSIDKTFRAMPWYRADSSATAGNIEQNFSPIETANLSQLGAARDKKQSGNATIGQDNKNRYLLTAEQIRAQAVMTQPLIEQIQAANQRKDTATMNRCLDEMIERYPLSPITVYLMMGQSFQIKDIPNATKFYNQLMTEYPDVDNLRALSKSYYDSRMRMYKDAQR